MSNSGYDRRITEWKGYERIDFQLEGRDAILIRPQAVAPNSPWVWRAEFFNAFSQVDMAMLTKGWHLAYFRISNLYGCPESIEMMKVFAEYMSAEFLLAKKPAIFGFSRGGLYAFNFAATYPEYVQLLYLDAPVLDIRSWPGKFGAYETPSTTWVECMNVYGLTEDTAWHFAQNPLNRIAEVAAAKIPIIVVAGDADDVVPLPENAGVLIEQYPTYGGEITAIIKPGIGHHPHSLEDVSPVVDFILANTNKRNDD